MRAMTEAAFIGPVLPTLRPLVAQLDQSLTQGEEVLAVAVVTYGRAGGILAITSRKVVVRSSGRRPVMAEWPLEQVSSMTATGGAIKGGKLTVTATDRSETVGAKSKTAERLAAAFRDAKAAAGVQGRRAPVEGSSAADELTKLAALLDRGLISREDFDAQKARLL